MFTSVPSSSLPNVPSIHPNASVLPVSGNSVSLNLWEGRHGFGRPRPSVAFLIFEKHLQTSKFPSSYRPGFSVDSGSPLLLSSLSCLLGNLSLEASPQCGACSRRGFRLLHPDLGMLRQETFITAPKVWSPRSRLGRDWILLRLCLRPSAVLPLELRPVTSLHCAPLHYPLPRPASLGVSASGWDSEGHSHPSRQLLCTESS